MNHPSYLPIGKALSGPIYALTRRDRNFGTGYEIFINGPEVTLQLMDGPAISGKIIQELKASSSQDNNSYAFISEIVDKLQIQLFEIECED